MEIDERAANQRADADRPGGMAVVGDAMSLCDTCVQPGHCCRDIPIHTSAWGNFYPHQWPEKAAEQLERELPGHPFIPLRLEMYPLDVIDPTAEGPYGFGRWSCKNLTPDGRCGDYDNRPNLCKNYEAGSDRLCVMYVPPEAAE
jgi:Fe-S-cluster containining protein